MANLNALLERVKKLEASRKVSLITFTLADGTTARMSAKRMEAAINNGMDGRCTPDSQTLLNAVSATTNAIAWQLVQAFWPQGFPWEPLPTDCDLLAEIAPMQPKLTDAELPL